MVSFTSVTLLALAYVSCLVNALPLDVAAPPVTYPTKGVVWKAGEKQTVTWDISHLPDQITNPIGKVVLGWLEGDGLNLQLDTPLAQGFPITAGKVDLIVPSQYPDGDTYIIALIGSSGNISPAFTITGGSSSSDSVNLGPSSVSRPEVQGTSVPGTPPSKTPDSTSSITHNAPSPTPTPSTPRSPAPPSSSSKSSSSPSPSGTQGSSNGNASDNSSAWGNKPANTMVVSLLAASLVMLFL